MESLKDRVRRVTSEKIEIAEYDPRWPELYKRERQHLLELFPRDLIVRVEHVGSTAVPGLGAKPVVDILVGVHNLLTVREQVAPRLEAQGYDYFWAPTHGDDGPPFYAFFIKRDAAGVRTHHIHVVAMDFGEHWDWVVFRDYLRAHAGVAARYEELKRHLAAAYPCDRVRYTEAKSDFIRSVLASACTPGGDAVLRQFRSSDAHAVHALIHRTIDASYSGVYPPQAVAFFKRFHSLEAVQSRASAGYVVVAEDNSGILATGTRIGDEISGVFVAPEGQGRGVGTQVMDALETTLLEIGGTVARLHVSLPSRGFYELRGYVMLSEGSIDVDDDQQLRYWLAEKALRHPEGTPHP